MYDTLHLSRHDGRYSVYNLPSVAEILSWYSDQILSCPTVALLSEPYRFDRLASGVRLNQFLRELLKKYEIYAPRFDVQTPGGADALCAFLMDPLPATGSMLPLVAAEIYETRPDLQRAFPGAHTAEEPSGYWRWFCRHSGDEYDIQLLVDRFRRVLMSASLADFSQKVANLLGGLEPLFLGQDRAAAARHIRMTGDAECADTLLEGRQEWYFFHDMSAAFRIYENRPDLQNSFPAILGKDFGAFCNWLDRHGPEEHGCAAGLGSRLRRCAPAESLARVFSYIARREDVARACQDSLLLDDSEPALRCLIRGAGEGLEYDLDDIVMLRFIHQTARHLLVPLYLELPLIRLRSSSARTTENNNRTLPEAVRDTPWSVRGCQLHATCFDLFEAYLDEEMRRWFEASSSPSREVIGFLRVSRHGHLAIRRIEPAYRAAARRLRPEDAAALPTIGTRLKEREHQPGVNVFGYFHSDIGVGESTRGLAQALAALRPVNKVPLCTGQLRDGTELSQLFQRFDYLSDTNVFVSYPHQSEDLLGMMRPEHLAGRRNIVHLAWEQKDANPWWKIVYDRYDEIWTVSEFAATAFRKMFPDRIRVVPNVLDFASFPTAEAARRTRLQGESLNYLFVFDANSSIERKNPEGVIDAFTRAFKGTTLAKRVRLTLKVVGVHRPEHAARIEKLRSRAFDSGLAIRFDGRQLPRSEMLGLISQADCYVSLHRAEGFGYTMAEAMFYGVPVVASGYSGNLEYMTHRNSLLVPCTETFVKSADGPFQRGSIWGDPDIDAAADMIRQVAERPAEALAIGELGRETVETTLSVAAVSRRLMPCFNLEADDETGSRPIASR